VRVVEVAAHGLLGGVGVMPLESGEDGLGPAARIDAMFRAALGRPADERDRAAAEALLAEKGGSWEGLGHALPKDSPF
jgi:hypothetical protein